MSYQFPFCIKNPGGETLFITGMVKEEAGDKIIGHTLVQPKAGPPMHVHWMQDEGFTVRKGTMAYQFEGEPVQFAGAGTSLVFKRGIPHKFWNAGSDLLECDAWVQPAGKFVPFISAVFEAQQRGGSSKPGLFDAAYLLMRYKDEYDMMEIPAFVKKVIFPIAYFIGKTTGRYKYFKDVP